MVSFNLYSQFLSTQVFTLLLVVQQQIGDNKLRNHVDWICKFCQLAGLNMKGVGRNDPCPCGSGKKYKKCCMGSDFGFYEPN